MASVKRTEVVQDDFWANYVESSKAAFAISEQVNQELIKLAESLTKIAKAFDGSAKSQRDLIKAEKESAQAVKEKIRNDQEQQKLLQQLEKTKQQKLRTEIQERKEQERLAKSTKKVETEYQKQSKRLNQLRNDYKNLILIQGKETAETRKMLAEIQRLDKTLKNVDARVGQFQRSVGNYGKASASAAAGVRKFAAAFGLVGGIQLFVRVLKDAFNVIKNFDQAQANLASVLGVSRESMGALTEQAKELGATTKFTAAQVAELQLEFAKLGFTQQEIENVTEATLQLAAAAGVDLATAATVTGSTLRGFGLETTETQRVVDVMAKSFSSSSLDMSKFQTAMASIAPVAKALNVSIEESTALLGTLTDAGVDAGTAGAGLRNLFLDANNAGLTLDQALDKIANSSDQVAASFELFGKRGATLGVILANNQTATESLTGKLENAGGAAQEMADKQLDTLGGALDILRSAWEGVILEMNEGTGAGEGLKEAIIALAEALPIIVKGLMQMGKAFGSAIVLMLKNVKIISDLIEKVRNGTATFKDFRDALRGVLGNTLKMIPGMRYLIDALEDTGEKTKKLTEEQKKNNIIREQSLKVGREIARQNRDEIDDIGILLDVIRSEVSTREEKNEAIAKLQEDYPDVIANINLETASTEQLISVKKELIKTMLLQKLEERKALEQAKVTNELFDLIFQRDVLHIKGLDDEIAGLQKRMTLIDIIAETIAEGFDDFAQNVAETDSAITGLDESIVRHEQELKRLNKQLKSQTEGSEEYNDTLKRIQKEEETLRKLRIKRSEVFDDGLDREKQGEEDLLKDKEGKKKKEVDAEKIKLDKLKALQNKHAFELIELENDMIRMGYKRDEINKALEDRRVEQFETELDFVNELGFKTAETYETLFNKYVKYLESIKREFKSTSNDIIEIEEDLKDITDQVFELDPDDAEKPIKKFIEKLGDAFDQLRGQISEFFDYVADQQEKRIAAIDREIEAQEKLYNQSVSREQQLLDIAKERRLDASESIKKEREDQKAALIAQRDLENKKQKVEALIAALQLLSQKIANGEGNPVANVKDDIQNIKSFIDGAFYQGTDTTIKDALGSPHVKGKDGYFVRVDGRERVMRPSLSERIDPTVTNDEVVNDHLAYRTLMTRNYIDRITSGAGNNEKVKTDLAVVGKLGEVVKAIQEKQHGETTFNAITGALQYRDKYKTLHWPVGRNRK